jgi:PAS domain S-box-containing protein
MSEQPPLISKLAQAGGGEAALLHFLLENIPVKIYFKDAESRFIRVSHSMAQLFGLTSAYEAIGKTDFDFFAREHAEPAFTDEQQVMRTGIPITDKIEKETMPNGEIRWAMTTKMPLRNPHGAIIGTCGISQDATAQKELEEALAASNQELLDRQQQLESALSELDQANRNLQAMHQQLLEAEKVQAIGRLAYGIAHEIRNPLNTLQAGLEFLAGIPSTPENQAQLEILEEMKSAIGQADAVVGILMDATYSNSLDLESCSARELLDQVVASLETHAESCEVVIRQDFSPDLPSIKVDRAKMEQVFRVIITNAIDAMPNGGELMVRGQLKQLSASDIKRDAGARCAERFRAGERVLLVEVEDTGAGIADEILTRIFDPFFTTKETGFGTGLGLTLCRRLIELHQGVIHIENRADCSGVRVSVLLKLSA